MNDSASGFDIEEHRDHVEVRGISLSEVAAALELYSRARTVQAEHTAVSRGDLVQTLMASNVPLTPPASLAQAQRLAVHRDALLATPVLTHATLRELRGDAQESSTRTWLSRRKEARELFTVSHGGRTLIPAFQLDERGEPRAELKPILDVLLSNGVQGWTLWTWLTSPTSLLSGAAPERLAQSAQSRVLRAARRFTASNAA